jgi:amino acid permease
LGFKESLSAITKSGIGTGLLFAPYIFYKAGPFWAIAILGVCPFLIMGSYNYLIQVLDGLENKKLDL